MCHGVAGGNFQVLCRAQGRAQDWSSYFCMVRLNKFSITCEGVLGEPAEDTGLASGAKVPWSRSTRLKRWRSAVVVTQCGFGVEGTWMEQASRGDGDNGAITRRPWLRSFDIGASRLGLYAFSHVVSIWLSIRTHIGETAGMCRYLSFYVVFTSVTQHFNVP
jgi:hypothetical protein